jgi:hypothetical protein
MAKASGGAGRLSGVASGYSGSATSTRLSRTRVAKGYSVAEPSGETVLFNERGNYVATIPRKAKVVKHRIVMPKQNRGT